MDSVQPLLLNASHRRLHSNIPTSGHIHKGHSFISHNATIPSKYETFVVDNKEKTGFNSTAQRFNYEQNENVCPGVGYYSDQTNSINSSPSYSKKGTGSFASKNRFQSRPMNSELPAPNNYNINLNSNKKDFNHSNSTSNFHSPIAVVLESKSAKLPAPNTYNIPSSIKNDKRSVSTSNFKSRTNRELRLIQNSRLLPGPGQYAVNKADRLMSLHTSNLKSVFNSKTKREFIQPADGPSPTQYNVVYERPTEKMEDKMQKHNRTHYLCLAANALKLPPASPQPGPGQYNVTVPLAEPSHFMSSSMFTSNTSRWTKPTVNIGIGIVNRGATNTMTEFPGPAQYQPTKLQSQSFHYNHNNKWVC